MPHRAFQNHRHWQYIKCRGQIYFSAANMSDLFSGGFFQFREAVKTMATYTEHATS